MNDASPKVPLMDPFVIEEGIRKLLAGLNSNTAVSPNTLQSGVLKEPADVLVSMVTLIYNAYKNNK